MHRTIGASGSKAYILDLKNGSGSCKEGEGSADATLIMADDDFVALMSGKGGYALATTDTLLARLYLSQSLSVSAYTVPCLCYVCAVPMRACVWLSMCAIVCAFCMR